MKSVNNLLNYSTALIRPLVMYIYVTYSVDISYLFIQYNSVVGKATGYGLDYGVSVFEFRQDQEFSPF